MAASEAPISWPPIPTAFRPCNSATNSASAPTSRRGSWAPNFAGPWSRRAARRWPVSPRSTRRKSPCAPRMIRSPVVAGAATVAPGITIRTDGWSGYPGAPDVAHDPHVIGPIAAHVVLPWIHRVFSNLKTWALGVYHGLRKKHLQAYLDEFVFRFNRRRTRHAAFRALLGIGVAIKSATYKMLIQPDVGG